MVDKWKTNKFAKKWKEENEYARGYNEGAYEALENAEQVKSWGTYNTVWQEGFDEGTVCGYESRKSDMGFVWKTISLTYLFLAFILGFVVCAILLSFI